MDNLSDSDLLQAYVTRRSEPAFAALVDRHLDLVYSAALRQVHDPHLAEEVAQAVFLILAQKGAEMRPGTILSGWLYRTARFAASHALRTEYRRQRREQEAQQMQPAPSDSDSDWEHIAPVLDEAMNRLSAKDRDAVVLHFFEKKSLREVGLALGTNEDAAQKRVSRAVEKLRVFITRRQTLTSGVALSSLLAAHAVHAAPTTLASSITAASLSNATAASASILNLMKGTLELMAWTKTKIAIVTGVACLLTLGTATVVLRQFILKKPAPQNIVGAWQGILQGNGATLRMVLHISQAPDGFYRATIDSIDQGAGGVPVTSVTLSNSTVRVASKGLFASYEAELNENGTEMSGTLQQGGRAFPVVLQRTDNPWTMNPVLPDSAYARRAGSDLQGYWNGTLTVGQAQLRIVFKISEPAPGTFAAVLDSIDQGGKNIPVTSVAYTKPSVQMDVTGIGGHFDGDLNPEATEISGTWEQGGRGFPLVLRRSNLPAGASKPDAAAYIPATATDLQGFWNGTLNVAEARLRLALQIAKMADGTFTGTMDSIDQGAKGIPMTSVTCTNAEVKMEWKALRAAFHGMLENGRLIGDFTQGPATFPLEFVRAKSPPNATPK